MTILLPLSTLSTRHLPQLPQLPLALLHLHRRFCHRLNTPVTLPPRLLNPNLP